MAAGLPLLVPSVDLTKLALTVDEAFVATRLDGHTTLESIAAMVGRDVATIERVVSKLAGLGAVTFSTPKPRPSMSPLPRASIAPERPSMSPTPRPATAPLGTSAASLASAGASPRREGSPLPPTTTAPRSAPAKPAVPPPPRGNGPFVPAGDGPHDYGDYVFSPTVGSDPTDLELETRKRVAYWHDQMDGWSHYQILGLDRKADAKAVKTAYFERSKDWHPDRFRRFKQLGPYGKMVEAIYKRVAMAYKILSDDGSRADYDKSLPRDLSAEDIESLLVEQIQAERDVRREEERLARRLKHNPVLARFGRAKHFYDQAVELEQSGKLAEAMRAAQMATTYDDRKPEFRALFERLRDLAADERVVPYVRRGRHFETMADWEEALSFYEEAVRIAPNNGEVRVRLAYTLLQSGKGADEVMSHAQRAVQLAGEDAESHYVLARCYEERANEKSAKRHYERALELRPGFSEAQKRLKRLKWGF